MVMIVHTCFNNQSEHGYKSSILKSGICKYMRRGEAEKMKWCVMEMALFQNHPKGQGLVTNLLNRLKILLMEEISPSEVSILRTGIGLLNDYDADRTQRHLLMTFCDLVAQAKRGRVVSYVGNWWRHHDCDLVKTTVTLCETYRKPGDSDELLLLGENLIEWMETKDERMFSVFAKMYEMEGGSRYRRKGGIYLWWEILNIYADPQISEILDFALQRFHRKGMTERWAFGIWMGLFVWKQELLDFTEKEYKVYTAEDCGNYYETMERIEMDEYVVNDYHVNKKWGLEDFAKKGAFIQDEDESFLADTDTYRKFYIEMKRQKDLAKQAPKPKKEKAPTKEPMIEIPRSEYDHLMKRLADLEARLGQVPVVPVVPKKVIPKKVTLDRDSLERIPWEDFSEVKILMDGVCGGKVPCILATYQGSRYVLKQMRESMNFGADYLIVDQCKEIFGLSHMNMRRIVSDKGLVKVDPKTHSYVNNCEIGPQESVYCLMDFWENVGDLGKHKGYLTEDSVKTECLKIRLFDGLFRSSDNILRNILVNTEGHLLSIDEGDLFGKRDRIFNRRGDWCSRQNISEDILETVMTDLLANQEAKVAHVIQKMQEFGLDYGKEFTTRWESYEAIVKGEWCE